MDKTFLIALCGARGVGKTSLANRLTEMFPDYKVIPLASELNEFGKKSLGQSFFDLEASQKDIVRSVYAKELVGRQRGDGIHILDMHLTDIREGQGKIIQPDVLLKNIRCFVFVGASVDSIRARALGSDKARDIAFDFMVRDQNAEREAARNLSQKYNVPFLEFRAEGSLTDLVVDLELSLRQALLERAGRNERKY